MSWNQHSYAIKEEEGCLFLVPTPIGNLQDMTFRAVETLKEVDYIAAEDTRQSRKLLNYFQIEKQLISYHEHNKEKKGLEILEDLKAGKRIALVTDAGMPGISDPGEDLTRLATEAHISVVALPGANAGLTALIASGLSTKRFVFIGFIDRQKKKREEELVELKYITQTLIFYEAPHRLKETLASMEKVLGADRSGAIVREISKKHEEYIRGSLGELVEWSEREEIRGEFCIIIQGNENQEELQQLQKEKEATLWWKDFSIVEHVDSYIEQGLDVKEAIKTTAVDRGMPKREVYQAYHVT
ncbi:16S rRNA (cytidine(1402)-2'-O)-methyltransferase [Caldalkalibacillus mannanilyticus]|uniref:16S rRNA (cytidine(1402)-2'-O)-methyltransferase n=1 Tax=Caldalkalibacillus mannanilyticus TaxID=1418 RepID=UPI00046A5092|nr:16S rRNA (cytidine(1402)-2'-O)-methyltransferase [Caldalkalibacillus mannanilyticus]